MNKDDIISCKELIDYEIDKKREAYQTFIEMWIEQDVRLKEAQIKERELTIKIFYLVMILMVLLILRLVLPFPLN